MIALLAVQSTAQTFSCNAIFFINTSDNAWYNQSSLANFSIIASNALVIQLNLGNYFPKKVKTYNSFVFFYWIMKRMIRIPKYRSGTVNSNTVNSKFHVIRSYCEIFFYHFPNISCLKCTVNSNFHLIRSKTLLTNDFELTVQDL